MHFFCKDNKIKIIIKYYLLKFMCSLNYKYTIIKIIVYYLILIKN